MKYAITAVLVGLVVAPLSPAAADANRPKPSSFEERAGSVLGFFLFSAMDSGIVLGFDSLPHMARMMERPNENTDVKELKKQAAYLRGFPDELSRALSSDDRKQQSTALKGCVGTYACVLRSYALLRGDNGDDLLRVALGGHAKRIKCALEVALKTADAKDRLIAAAVLLQLDPQHAHALTALKTGFTDADADVRSAACEMVGGLGLSHPDVVASVVDAVADKDAEVRRSAACAVSRIGPKAKKAVPALLELLQSGDADHCDVSFKYAITLGETRNGALLALGAMGEDAGAAVPTIRAMLKAATAKPRASDERGFVKKSTHPLDELLQCLIDLGPRNKDAIGDLRTLMKKANEHQLHIAAALLCLDREDRKAREILEAGLSSVDKETRSRAAKACATMKPKAKALVASLVKLMDDSDSLEEAVLTLRHMGPVAEEAIPSLVKILTDDDNSGSRNFITRARAAFALAGIGRTSVPELISVVKNRELKEGREDAAWALGQIGADAAMAVPVLIDVAADKKEDYRVRRNAVIALGLMKGTASSAKRCLLRLVEDDNDLAHVTEDNYLAHLAVWSLSQLSR
jgi:phosphotransferase system HPr-like phosphotransfer protein